MASAFWVAPCCTYKERADVLRCAQRDRWYPVVRLCIEILHDGTGSDGDAGLPLLRNAVESLASAGAGLVC